jgi:hypothetical protein
LSSHRDYNGEEFYLMLSSTGQIKLDEHFLDVHSHDAVRVAPRVARTFEVGPDGFEFLAFGPHHPGDGEAVDDPWVGEHSSITRR